jgi:hypothetical protein
VVGETRTETNDDTTPGGNIARPSAPQVLASAVSAGIAYDDTQPELPIIRQPEERPTAREPEQDLPRPEAAPQGVESKPVESRPAIDSKPMPSSVAAATSPAASTPGTPSKPQGRLLPWEPAAPAAGDSPVAPAVDKVAEKKSDANDVAN